MTKGVIFDVDGTLVDTVYLHCTAWWQALRQHGWDVETARIHRAIGMGSDRRVVLASSASPPELAALRRALDADDLVHTVTGAADAEASKPAPDIVQVALERSKLRPQDVVFVGDTVWDVQAANALGIPCIGVTCGGISEAELLEAGAAGVYANPKELLDKALGQL